MLYPISEIFYSIQGEGRWTGRAAVFIRFAGCNLSCDYCDTDHKKYMELSLKSIITFLKWWAPHTRDRIPIPMIVLTGGEPTIKDLKPLVKALVDAGWYIALETNGTHPERIPREINFVTLSPKYGHDYSKWDNIGTCIGELKVIFDPRVNPKEFRKLFNASWYYIQPLSEDYEPAVEFVKENPEWMLSVQTQKYIGIK